MNKKLILFILLVVSLILLGTNYKTEECIVIKEDNYITQPEITVEKIYYDIDLSHELQDFVFVTSYKYNISPELIFAIMKLESNYDVSVVSINSNKSKDIGLMQLNSRYMYDFAKDAGVDNFDPLNPYHNIEVGVFVLAKHREYWQSQGYSEEMIFDLILSSYNKGRYGTKSKGVARGYVDRVLDYKIQLETCGEIK